MFLCDFQVCLCEPQCVMCDAMCEEEIIGGFSSGNCDFVMRNVVCSQTWGWKMLYLYILDPTHPTEGICVNKYTNYWIYW